VRRQQGTEIAPLRLQLEARPEFAALLRKRVRLWLDDAGVAKPEAFEMLLSVNEAFRNAIQHPHEPLNDRVDIEAECIDHSFIFSIRDYGTWQGEESGNEDRGMGFRVMEALMDAVLIERSPQGTTVTMHRKRGRRVWSRLRRRVVRPVTRRLART